MYFIFNGTLWHEQLRISTIDERRGLDSLLIYLKRSDFFARNGEALCTFEVDTELFDKKSGNNSGKALTFHGLLDAS